MVNHVKGSILQNQNKVGSSKLVREWKTLGILSHHPACDLPSGLLFLLARTLQCPEQNISNTKVWRHLLKHLRRSKTVFVLSNTVERGALKILFLRSALTGANPTLFSMPTSMLLPVITLPKKCTPSELVYGQVETSLCHRLEICSSTIRTRFTILVKPDKKNGV